MVIVAFTQNIPANWIRKHPNVARLPHVYNLDNAVGLSCPNKRLDVMLIQVMLLIWATERKSGSLGSPNSPNALDIGNLPLDGVFDNRVQAWIYYYQLYHYHERVAAMTGKIVPAAADGSSLGDRFHTLLHLNSQLGPSVDLASRPATPRDLALALKVAK